MNVIKMCAAMVAPLLLAVMFYLWESKGGLSKMKTLHRQIIAGAVFGVLACLDTQFGIHFDGFVMNVRSAAPLTAGLVFGGPAGIIAGVMGAVYRYVSVLWGVASYTQIACSVATLMAGIIATMCRKYMFGNKRIPWFYGAIIAVTTEVLHMLLVFLTHMDDIQTAFNTVQQTAIYMILANTIALSLPLIFSDFASKTLFGKEKKEKSIIQEFSIKLFICILLSFVITTVFSHYLQKNVTDMETKNLITMNVNDVLNDIKTTNADSTTEDALSNIAANRHIGQNGFMFIATADGKIVSAPVNSVTNENITQFLKEIPGLSDGEISSYTTIEGVDYLFAKAERDGYIVVGCLPQSEADFSENISVYIEAFMLLIVFFALFVLVFTLLKLSIVNNVNKVNDSLEKISGGDLSTVVDVRENEEFSSLSDFINHTVTRLKGLISEAEERSAMELSFARSVQQSVLPSEYPPFPDRQEFDIYALMATAKEVGGDFYDYYLLDKDRLLFLIADVSGKGIPAAMFMMNAKSVIKSYAENGNSVSEIFTRANSTICKNNDAEMFVTAWLGIIDLRSGVTKFVNAGHNPPLLKRDGKFEYLKSRPGLVLGGMDGIKYRENEITLSPGDEIFLYTDGVTEATDKDTQMFGEQRLINVLNEDGTESAYERCISAITAVSDFVGDEPQFDDITMVSFKFCRAEENTMKTLTVPALNTNIDTVTEFIDGILMEAGCPVKTMRQINIAADEIFSNISNYAYEDRGGDATISVSVSDSVAKIEFRDSGVPFDALNNNDPDVTMSVEERNIGGLGIFMVKKLMDNVEYAYVDGENVLTIYKNI